MNISQHGNQLLEKLTNARIDCTDRPLIFVAHSLGGILVKDAIIESKKYTQQPRMQALADNCVAIMFFGTPHLGANAAEWGLVFRNIIGTIPGGFSTYGEILRGLSPDSEKLDNLTRDFNDVLDANIPIEQKIKIYNFQEGKGLTGVKGLGGKVVPDHSSAFGRRTIEKTCFINENHMNICRFKSRNDSGYEDFRANLAEYLVNVSQRGRETNTGQSKAKDEVVKEPESELAALLQSLDFEGRCIRENQLWELETNEATFEWFWNPPSPFVDWLSGDESFFWICGKPASGKSTLMHHLWRSDSLSNFLGENTSHDWTVIHHFFDFRAGEGIRNDFGGFLRSLLLQLCSKLNSAVPLPEANKSTDPTWTIGSLRTRLLKELEEPKQPLCILLDGLDDYQGNAWELIQFVRQMARGRVKVCVASRPSPVFDATLQKTPTLKMQDLNFQRIKIFVDQTLENSLSNSDFYDDKDFVKFSQQIATMANGVFLWARFAIFELAQGYVEGDNLEVLQERLKQVPPKLEDIYSRIFKRLQPERKREAGILLRLVCFTQRTLTLQELMAAIEHSGVETTFQLTDCSESKLQTFQRKILGTTLGVLEVFWSDVGNEVSGSCYKIQSDKGERRLILLVDLTHRTVRTFLDSKGWLEILGMPHAGDVHAETLWTRVCTKQFPPGREVAPNELKYFVGNGTRPRRPGNYASNISERANRLDANPLGLGSKTRHTPSRGRGLPQVCAPLREYAAIFVFHHAMNMEDITSLSSFRLLGPSVSLSLCCLHNYYWGRVGRDCECQWHWASPQHLREPLLFAISHNLSLFVDDYLSFSSSNNMPSSKQLNASYSSQFNDLFPDSSEPDSGDDEEILLLNHALSHGNAHVIASVLKYRPVVDDTAMVTGLLYSSPAAIHMLLKHRSDRFMILRPKNLSSSWAFEDQNPKRTVAGVYAQNMTELILPNPAVRPLWVISRSFNGQKEYSELIDIFVARGEDINGVCGPFGTALHGALSRLVDRPYWFWSQSIEILINKGANVNAPGPLGNALEYAWLLANTFDNEKNVYRFENEFKTGHARAIRTLLDAGGVNNIPDPKGQIPTPEWMRRFCEQDLNGLDHFQKIFFGQADRKSNKFLNDRIRYIRNQQQRPIDKTEVK